MLPIVDGHMGRSDHRLLSVFVFICVWKTGVVCFNAPPAVLRILPQTTQKPALMEESCGAETCGQKVLHLLISKLEFRRK